MKFRKKWLCFQIARRRNCVPVVHRNGLRYSNKAGRRKRQKRLNNTTVPLSLLLPEYVAEHWVIFITNEINNAAIYPQLCPGGVHWLREMRILISSNKAIAKKAVQQNRPRMNKYNWMSHRYSKCSKTAVHAYDFTHLYTNNHVKALSRTQARKYETEKHVILNLMYSHLRAWLKIHISVAGRFFGISNLAGVLQRVYYMRLDKLKDEQ